MTDLTATCFAKVLVLMRRAIWLVGVLSASLATAQTWPVETIIDHGPQTNRINLVVIAEGYTASEQTKFSADMQTLVMRFFASGPLQQYASFFNVYAIHAESAQSGAKHPNTAADCPTGGSQVPVSNPTNLLGTTFDYAGTHRLLYSSNQSAINQLLSTNTPWFDKGLVLVNSAYYGGSGGAQAFGSTNASSAEIMIHEFGHSFAALADEYGGASCGSNVSAPNVTKQTQASSIPWSVWIDAQTPLPTPANTLCSGVGLYEGAYYCDTGIYRPMCNCKMRSLGVPLCAVCFQEFVKKIMTYVSLIDSFSPAMSTVNVTTGTQPFSVATLSNSPDTIERTWSLDGVTVHSGAAYTLNAGPLTPGTHTLTFTAQDQTIASRVALPTFTQSWSVVKTGPVVDAGVADAGAADVDAGGPDAGVTSDAGVTDAGLDDAGFLDDAGVTDAGMVRAPVIAPLAGGVIGAAGCSCGAAGSGPWWLALALVWLWSRRVSR